MRQIMPVFPLHKYLGPGNGLNEGDIIHIDDNLAYLHDNDYQKKVIRSSDKHFVCDFLIVYIQNGNVHSLLWYIALESKY